MNYFIEVSDGYKILEKLIFSEYDAAMYFVDRRRKQGLAILAAHDHEHLAEHAQAVLVYEAEHDGDRGLLPELQGDQVVTALTVVAEGLDELDGVSGLPFIEKK